MNTLVTQLAEACRAQRLREKWLIAPSRRIAHQWLDQVTRAGAPVVNVRVESLRSLALRLLAPQLAGGRPAVIGAAASRLLVAAAWQRAVQAGGYLAATAMTPRLLAMAERTLLDLRLAGLRTEDLEAGRFEPEAKGRDIRALLIAYESELTARGFVDHADIMRMAAVSLKAGPPSSPEALLIIPDDVRLAALERRFLEALGPGRVLRLPVDQPAGGAGAPRDGTLRIVRAVGEINEVRQALRSCLAEGIPLDQVELLYSAAEPYVPLIYDTAQRAFEFDQSLDLGVPVTFAEGVPARLSRPGRLLRAWLTWIRQDYPQTQLLQMLEARLLRLPVNEEGDPVGAARLVRALRSLGIGFGRDRYATCVNERLDGLARLSEQAAAAARSDDDKAPRDPEWRRARQGAMKALAGMIKPLLDVSPPWNTPAEHLVASAVAIIRDHARIGGSLDGLARQRLLQELESMDRALAAGGAPPGFDAWEWLGELPDRLRVAGSGPRPGHLHAAALAAGGHSGRGHTIIIGLDDSRFPSAGHQDPLVLDGERKQLGKELTLTADRLRQQMEDFARLLGRLRGAVTLSYSSCNLDDDSETFASPVVLSAWRIISGERRGDHSALKRAYPAPASFAPLSPGECLDAGEWWLSRGSQEQPVGNLAELGAASFPHLERGARAGAARATEAFTVFDGLIEDPGPELDPRREEGPVLSATGKLQTLGTCPLRYFYREVLHVRPPDDLDVDPERWLSHLDFGTLLHEVLQDFVGLVIGAEQWPPQPQRDLALMNQVVDAHAGDWQRRVPPPNAEAYRRQRRELDGAAEIFVNEQSRPRHTQRPSVPLYLEAAFGGRGPARTEIDTREPIPVELASGFTIRCSGRIDRIDRRLDGDSGGDGVFVLWDYKSGRSVKRFDPSDVFDRGRLVQHALYMDMAETVLKRRFGPQATVDEFIFFFPSAAVRGRIVDFGPDIIAGGKAVIRRLCELAARGAFVPTNTADDCNYCDYRRACQAVNPDLKAYCSQAGRKLANRDNHAIAPFVELRLDR